MIINAQPKKLDRSWFNLYAVQLPRSLNVKATHRLSESSQDRFDWPLNKMDGTVWFSRHYGYVTGVTYFFDKKGSPGYQETLHDHNYQYWQIKSQFKLSPLGYPYEDMTKDSGKTYVVAGYWRIDHFKSAEQLWAYMLGYHWAKKRAAQGEFIEKSKTEIIDHSQHRISRAKTLMTDFAETHLLKIPDFIWQDQETFGQLSLL